MTTLYIYSDSDDGLFRVSEDGIRELRYINVGSAYAAARLYCDANGLDIDECQIEDRS